MAFQSKLLKSIFLLLLRYLLAIERYLSCPAKNQTIFLEYIKFIIIINTCIPYLSLYFLSIGKSNDFSSKLNTYCRNYCSGYLAFYISRYKSQKFKYFLYLFNKCVFPTPLSPAKTTGNGEFYFLNILNINTFAKLHVFFFITIHFDFFPFKEMILNYAIKVKLKIYSRKHK